MSGLNLESLTPMRVNAGGMLSPEQVVGRNQLIRQFWEILSEQSLIINAERRMGKTSIIRKMESEPLGDRIAIYQDLEGIKTPLEFVDTVLNGVKNYLSRVKKTQNWLNELNKSLGGMEIGGLIKLPASREPDWKPILTQTFADLVKHQSGQVVFLWDEVPFMLDKIKQNQGEQVATDVLDILRQLRQTHPALRMVYTGSIGLHHVLSSFKNQGYGGEPTNDMAIMDVPPLAEEQGTILTAQLLKGEGINCPMGIETTAKAIALSVDCIPFYIQNLVRKLKEQGIPENLHLAPIVEDALIDPNNLWRMEHYRERINKYYLLDERKYAIAILDILGNSDYPLAFNKLLNSLSVELEQNPEKEMTRKVLNFLQKDYYLTRDRRENDFNYRFRHPLIKRYWQLSKG
jgi:hypothetical protein